MDRRAAILAGASGALVALGVYAVARRPTAGQEVAQVIANRTAPLPDAGALADERLTGDANEAGYRWAERSGLTMRADCPTYSKAFHDGCESYVSDQALPQ